MKSRGSTNLYTATILQLSGEINMRIFINVVYCIILPSVLSIPVLLFIHYNNWQYIYISSISVYVITLLLVIVFFRFRAKKENPFILPVSFFIFPLTLYFLMSGMRLILDVKSDPGGWEIFTVFVAMYYSLPFLIITLIASIIYTVKKARSERKDELRE